MTVPKEYFEDHITKGVARGTLRHLFRNRFCIVNLPVGFGKTDIAVMTAMGLAKMNHGELQVAVIAPKSKRLDKSFDDALDSASKYYHVKLTRLPVNKQAVGTFAGLTRMSKKPKEWRAFAQAIIDKPTMFILDETHMTLRDSTSKTSKHFKALLDAVDRAGGFAKVTGLTATPFDKSILDGIGYLVFNGNYNSRTAFYREEVPTYKNAYARGLTQRELEAQIVDNKYIIHKEMFTDIRKVVRQLREIIYSPDAPRDFHIPKNKLLDYPVSLANNTLADLKLYDKMRRDKAFGSPTEARVTILNAMATDPNLLHQVVRLAKKDQTKLPLIFYQYDVQLEALKNAFAKFGHPIYQINGHSHSYFDGKIDPKGVVFIQYTSGATAFEAKLSNTSIYYVLPDSAINFSQSLGRNARRGQELDIVDNYIMMPMNEKQEMPFDFYKQYNRIKNKTVQNQRFLKAFITPWGMYEKPSTKKKVKPDVS